MTNLNEENTMTIEIRHRYDKRVLYTAEHAQDVRAAVVEAAKRGADLGGAYLGGAYLGGADLGGADLRGAYLGGADLGGADLRGAYLRDADLRGADLRGADLRGADLGGAYLRGAYLRGADLRGADDWRSPLWTFRADVWDILDRAPAEVPALREALVDGRVDGSTYSGECSCLCGTVATAHGITSDIEKELREQLGIITDASRPAERWFAPIEPGDRAVGDKPEDGWSSEGVFRASLALGWVDEWVVSRTAIATALSGDSDV